MTFNYIAAKKIFDCLSIIDAPLPKAIDIGVQTPSIRQDTIEKFINLKNLTKKQDFFYKEIIEKKNFSTRDFFLALGYDEYSSIDINGAENSFEFDLNYDLQETYGFKEKYDLVVNNGTGEHVFNQYCLFKNIHQITNNNGLMLHILPFVDWINHGFYNFNPIFFADLASSNDYEIEDITLANRNGAELSIKNKSSIKILFEQVKPNYESNFKTVLKKARGQLGENILIVVILRKKTIEPFKVPLQGKYLQDISLIDSEYSNQGLGSATAFGQEKDGIKRGK